MRCGVRVESKGQYNYLVYSRREARWARRRWQSFLVIMDFLNYITKFRVWMEEGRETVRDGGIEGRGKRDGMG